MYKIRYSEPSLDAKDIKAAVKVLKTKTLSGGPTTQYFEKKFSNKFKIKNCLAVSNASNALILALKSHKIKSNDIVWTSTVTFCSNLNSGLHLNANIVLLDIDKSFPNLNLDDIEKKLKNTSKKNLPKFLILTYMGGFCIDLSKLSSLKKKYKFKIIEDASHCIGAKYFDKKYIGSNFLIDATIFSCHAVKIITAGEGAILAINNKKIFQNAKLLRSHAIVRKKNCKIWNFKNSKLYDVIDLGFNFRITDIQSSILTSQLNKLNLLKSKRLRICNYYIKNLSKKYFIIPRNYLTDSNISSLHLFIIYLNKEYIKYRDNLIDGLKKKGIELNIHYTPNHLYDYYRKNKHIKFDKSKMKNSENYFQKCITLPLHPNLKKKHLKKILFELNNFFNDKIL